MTNDEIREATKELESCIKKYGDIPTLNKLKPLLTLAEEYLNLKGWPEKREVQMIYTGNAGYNGGHNCIVTGSGKYARGFNSALRLCKLAAMKEKNRLSEGIRNIIAQPPDRISEITIEGYEQIRQKLLELINGKEEICQKNTTE